MATGETMCKVDPWELDPGLSTSPQQNTRATSTGVHRTMDFDAGTAETAFYTGILPSHYAAGGLNVRIRWAAASATTNAVKWNIAFERNDTGTLDIDADSFASIQTTTTTTSGTSGVNVDTVVTFTNAQIDGLVAGETFRMSVKRDAADGADNMTGDAQITMIVITEV